MARRSRPLRRHRIFCPLILVAFSVRPAAAGDQASGRVASAKSPVQRQSPEAELSRGKLAYERGDYAAAIAALRPLLYPQALLPDEEQVFLAHKLLGLCYLFEQDEAGAEQEFNLLLSLRPDFALDPVVEPVKAVAFVDNLRRRNESRLAEIRRRQEQEEERRRAAAEEERRRAAARERERAPRIYIERVVRRRFSALDLLPFGVPQLAAGRRVTGALLLTGEALCGAASLGTWLTVRLRYPEGTFPPREYVTAQALTATYLTTGVLFWGLVGAGLIEALLHSRTVVEVRELPGPPKELQMKAKQRKLSFQVSPLLPGLPTDPAGLSLGARF